MSTDVKEFIGDLNAGVFESQLSRILSSVAAAVVNHGKAGKVTIDLDIKQIEQSHQVTVKHTTKFSLPTSAGGMTEHITHATPMHVGTNGRLTFLPENQIQLFGEKKPTPQDD